jgi:hypothetical protein
MEATARLLVGSPPTLLPDLLLTAKAYYYISSAFGFSLFAVASIFYRFTGSIMNPSVGPHQQSCGVGTIGVGTCRIGACAICPFSVGKQVGPNNLDSLDDEWYSGLWLAKPTPKEKSRNRIYDGQWTNDRSGGSDIQSRRTLPARQLYTPRVADERQEQALTAVAMRSFLISRK